MKKDPLTEKWYDAYAPALYGFVLAVTEQDPDKSDELFTLAFFRIHENKDLFDPAIESILPWLMRQVIQTLIKNGYEMVDYGQASIAKDAKPLPRIVPDVPFAPF